VPSRSSRAVRAARSAKRNSWNSGFTRIVDAQPAYAGGVSPQDFERDPLEQL
jgi:hypothetical protein